MLAALVDQPLWLLLLLLVVGLVVIWGVARLTWTAIAKISLLALLGLVGFAILQPLIWRERFGEDPPVVIRDLGTLLTILVTLVSFTIAGVGIIVYQTLRERLDKSTEEAIQRMKEITEEASAKTGEAIHRVKEITEEASAKADLALCGWHLLMSNDFWRKYDEKSERYAPSETEHVLRQFLDSAVTHARLARKASIRLPDDKDEHEQAKWQSTNALAYHLASRGLPADEEKALALVKELGEPSPDDFHALETIAWVYLRFSTSGQPNWEEGVRIFGQLLRSQNPPQDWKDEVRIRYGAVFGLDEE